MALPESKLPVEFYARPALDVAVDLLGRRLVRADGTATHSGVIVETEAYVGPEDLACHAARGRTRRTEVMFGPAGVAYVYFVYGMHYCLNAVTDREGFPAAVLIRALEPNLPAPSTSSGSTTPRTDGPARLCQALDIDRTFNGESLTGERLYITAGERPVDAPAPRRPVASGPRIGVAYAGEWAERPYRFWLTDSVWTTRR